MRHHGHFFRAPIQTSKIRINKKTLLISSTTLQNLQASYNGLNRWSIGGCQLHPALSKTRHHISMSYQVGVGKKARWGERVLLAVRLLSCLLLTTMSRLSKVRRKESILCV